MSDSSQATTMPITGASTMKISVLVQPDAMSDPQPALAIAAPAYPPTRACDELVGRPTHQVIRSQRIAPTRPPKITAEATMARSIMPRPIVEATAVPKPKAARKLKAAAQNTAWPGVSTRVETTVAIEFAASWKPLMKSNVSATKIRASTATSVGSISYPFLRTTPSSRLATSSHRSVAASRKS